MQAPKIAKAEDKHGRMGAMMNTETVPGPGTYIGVESKLCGPKFTIHGRGGVSEETMEKSTLQRCRSEGAPATGQRDIRRFLPYMLAVQN